MTIDIDDLERNDVDGALHYWIQELRAGRSCYETTNMLMHLQDDPEDLMDGIAKATAAVGISPNSEPKDDSALVDALGGETKATIADAPVDSSSDVKQRTARATAALVAKRRPPAR